MAPTMPNAHRGIRNRGLSNAPYQSPRNWPVVSAYSLQPTVHVPLHRQPFRVGRYALVAVLEPLADGLAHLALGYGLAGYVAGLAVGVPPRPCYAPVFGLVDGTLSVRPFLAHLAPS